jgi:hypothetical protein
MLPVMKALDANSDRELSAEEINNAVAALKTLDKDNDGKVSESELTPAIPAQMSGRGRGGPRRPPIDDDNGGKSDNDNK